MPSEGTTRSMRTAAVAVSFVVAVSATAGSQATQTVRDGVYTDAQAARGQAIYSKQCASCHGDSLQGAQAPPLAGDAFLSRWRQEPLSALAGKIRHTMPVNAQGTLTAEQTADLVAHVLKTSSFPPGRSELAADDPSLSLIGWPAVPLEQSAGTSAASKTYPPLGNMAQLMRAIFFPSSNLIFTVQTRDPGAAAAPAAGSQSGSGGFSFVEWGTGIYGGWELVDNAAIALADASPLMLAPGIRCENGRLAPVTDADWIRFTEEMIGVARRMYRVSQTRNQEAVSEATGDLSDACANCHRAYRDVRVPGRTPDPADPSNKAARCMPR